MNTRKLSAFAAKYKYVLIILLAGLILLLLPTGSRTKAKTAQAAAVSEQTQPQTIQAEEQRLTTLLQQINGAGQVQVLLSYRCSAERELATDDSGEPTIISAGGGHRRRWSLRRSARSISAQSSSVTGRIRRRCSSPSRRQWHSLPA